MTDIRPQRTMKNASCIYCAVVADRHGGLTVPAAIWLSLIFIVLSSSANIGFLIFWRQQLQSATDAATLAVAAEMQQSDETLDEKRAREIAQRVIIQHLGIDQHDLQVAVAMNDSKNEVQLQVRRDVNGFVIGRLLQPAQKLESIAAARVLGRTRSNAEDTAYATADAESQPISIAGRKLDERATVQETDGHATARELRARAAADQFPGCGRAQKVALRAGDYGQQLAVYAGDISVSGGARATLRPGHYIVADSSTPLPRQSSTDGPHSSFFLTGEGALMDLLDAVDADEKAIIDGVALFDMAALKLDPAALPRPGLAIDCSKLVAPMPENLFTPRQAMLTR